VKGELLIKQVCFVGEIVKRLSSLRKCQLNCEKQKCSYLIYNNSICRRMRRKKNKLSV